jgi:hypothetical protein
MGTVLHRPCLAASGSPASGFPIVSANQAAKYGSLKSRLYRTGPILEGKLVRGAVQYTARQSFYAIRSQAQLETTFQVGNVTLPDVSLVRDVELRLTAPLA